MTFQFGDCTLDLEARRLTRAGREAHLSPKAFELLRILIDHRGRALSKAELLERVWPRVFVSDASLARVVTEIRDVVGDRARKAGIIRTVHGYGYAFAAAIEEREPAAAARGTAATCWIVWRKRAFPLTDGEHIVGRDPAATVWLDSLKVSRHHARVVVRGTEATIADLGSKNGTIVGGVRIHAPVRLEAGDEIRVGPFTLSFRAGHGTATIEQ